MNRREFLNAGVAAAALTGLGGVTTASAQAKVVLKATDVHPLGYPTVEAVVRMGKRLEAATNGRISIQMFPSMQLGGEKEMIEQAQVGALQIARISLGPMGPLVPELNAFNLPFVFRDPAHMTKVVTGPIGDEMLKKLSDHPTANLIGLCWMNGGTRNVYNSKKPIKTMDDLKGLKIRMMGNPIFVDTMNAMGGNGVAMGFDQLINALQTGVVDGAENNEPSYVVGPALSLRQVLLDDAAPDHPGNPGVLEAHLADAVEGRSGPDHEGSQGRPDRAVEALGRVREEVDRRHEGERRRDHQGRQHGDGGRRQEVGLRKARQAAACR